MLVAGLFAATPLWAQMTPMRPLSSPGTARQWSEPPAAPAPAAQLPANPPKALDEHMARVPNPVPQASPIDEPPRPGSRSARAGGGRAGSANQMNRRELARPRSGGRGYYPGYYGGYYSGYAGLSPHAGSGD
jgi:hypothetical protein